MNTILVIIKKELKRFFTDRRMLISLLLPGFLIYFVYSFMGNYTETPSNEYNVGIVNRQSALDSLFNIDGFTIEYKYDSKDILIKELNEDKLDLVVVYEQDFYDKMIAYTVNSSESAPNVEIYYNSSDTDSYTIYQYFLSIFDSFESSISNKFNVNGLGDVYDIAKEEDVVIQMMTMIMPFLFVVLLFSSAMSICCESIAGEKERGTIATLLVTPVKRSYLVLGKVISLGITALVSALVSFIGLMASLPKLIGSDIDMSLKMYDISTFILIFVVILSTVLIFTVILMITSTFAKSVKEASSYAIPVMMLVMLMGLSNFTGGIISNNVLMYAIPIYNSIQCISGVLSLNVDVLSFIICIVSNIGYFMLGVYALTKMFNNENIMFKK